MEFVEYFGARFVDGMIGTTARIFWTLRSLLNFLDILHSDHASVSTMCNRAASYIFWPSMTAEIEQVRAHCPACTTIAPSNPRRRGRRCGSGAVRSAAVLRRRMVRVYLNEKPDLNRIRTHTKLTALPRCPKLDNIFRTSWDTSPHVRV